ncbi:iron complex transport system permease protein [Prauserella isguenensis]|uniref:Iron complex transport system permease protein n=1 Tax=Prauserella isguenensis TaxID=1470180 RepID=A0A839RW50_9PSEU|nr:iron chelate uptake ABC transporter family permease subunit [Prauserella isguenensis]MBB3049332.1 iron complex transport system permease protein [Prauserella isguenensis]
MSSTAGTEPGARTSPGARGGRGAGDAAVPGGAAPTDRASATAHEPPTPAPTTRGTVVRGAGLLVAVGVLLLLALASVWFGSKGIPFLQTWDLLWHADGSDASVVIHEYRIPRTILAVLVGASLGLAGALMQALTRNPLADPGLLGITMGASTGVALALTYLGITTVLGYVWLAFAGAAVASVVVYALGSAGARSATPERLVVAGAAVTAVLFAVNSGLMLTAPDAFEEFRRWQVGSLSGRYYDVLLPVLPFMAVGVAAALLLMRPLNALAMGDDLGKALGAHPDRIRIAGAVAITLLCGAATAAVGPIGFVGLAVPHVARFIAGPDQRWVLPYSLVLAPMLLVGADVAGRVVAPPAEIQVGIVTAVIGVPVFLVLCRKRKLTSL